MLELLISHQLAVAAVVQMHFFRPADLEEEVVFRVDMQRRDGSRRRDEHKGLPLAHAGVEGFGMLGDLGQAFVEQGPISRIALDVFQDKP
jgi:hypothetical protein